MLKVLAVICRLGAPADCHEETVTTSDFAEISLQACLMGAPQLADWMRDRPGYRLAAWRCAIGDRRLGT